MNISDSDTSFSREGFIMLRLRLFFGFVVLVMCQVSADQSIYNDHLDELTILAASSFPTAFANKDTIRERCFNDSRAYLSAFLKQESWALKMHGATGKLPVIGPNYNDNLAAAGLFEPCLASSPTAQYCTAFFHEKPANSTLPLSADTNIRKQQQPFSWLYVHLQDNSNFIDGPSQPTILTDGYPFPAHVGYCLPSSCSNKDVASAVAQLSGLWKSNRLKQIVTTVDENFCYTNEKLNHSDVKFDSFDTAITLMFFLLGVTVVVATLNECWRERSGKPINPRQNASRLIVILNCFSALSNCRKLLAPSSYPRFACIDGIRFLSSTWMILFHIYVFSNNAPVYNRYGNGDLYNWKMQIISRCVAMESFLLLGGIVVSLSLLKELDRSKGKISIVCFYFKRYVRITVMYSLVVGLVATLVVHLGTGPYWQFVQNMKNECRFQGWSQFLYITRGYPCIGSAWYLSLDMKLFFLSPLFVYPLWRWRKAGFSLVIFSILAFLLYIAFYMKMKYDGMTANDLYRPSEPKQNSDRIEFNFWLHMPSRLGGILLGWLLYYMLKNQRNFTLRRFAVAFGWFSSFALMGSVIFGLTPYLDERKVPKVDEFVRVTYGSLFRLAWASAVGWIIFACCSGYGGIINSILSWKPFTILSRLTLSTFLIHEVVIRVYYVGYIRQPTYYSLVNLFFVNNLAVQILSLILSFILTIWAEMPLVNLIGIALAPRKLNYEYQSKH